MDGINIGPVGTILSTFGWGGIVAIAVWLIFTGKLIPKSVVDSLLQRAGEEAQRWRTAYENSELARSKDRDTTMKALEATQATAHVVRAFNDVVSKPKEARDPQ